jgi:hypothetical protein
MLIFCFWLLSFLINLFAVEGIVSLRKTFPNSISTTHCRTIHIFETFFSITSFTSTVYQSECSSNNLFSVARLWLLCLESFHCTRTRILRLTLHFL